MEEIQTATLLLQQQQQQTTGTLLVAGHDETNMSGILFKLTCATMMCTNDPKQKSPAEVQHQQAQTRQVQI